MKRAFALVFAALLFAVSASALDLGDPAPEITPAQWVTGDPADPTKVSPDTFYLVEVWSVTCPPCVQSIPILNILQEKYADQGFKIVSFTSDDVEQVKEFLNDHPMEYSSFIDEEGATYIRYMAADNRNTIPHAFLFDRGGSLVWIGNPLDNLEAKIKAVIDGTMNREIALAVKDAREKLQQSFEAQNVTGMLDSLTRLEAIEPSNGQYYQLHYRILTELGAGEESEIRELLESWYRGSQDDPESLMVLSVVALEQGHPRVRNPELALAAAKRAFNNGKDAPIEAGLNLAEIYKAIGRIDLSLDVMKTLVQDAKPDEIDVLSAIVNYYERLQELGKNPDASYE